jgi:hypothetical protein
MGTVGLTLNVMSNKNTTSTFVAGTNGHTYYISTVSNRGLRNIPQGQHRLVAAQVVYAIANYAAVVSKKDEVIQRAKVALQNYAHRSRIEKTRPKVRG